MLGWLSLLWGGPAEHSAWQLLQHAQAWWLSLLWGGPAEHSAWQLLQHAQAWWLSLLGGGAAVHSEWKLLQHAQAWWLSLLGGGVQLCIVNGNRYSTRCREAGEQRADLLSECEVLLNQKNEPLLAASGAAAADAARPRVVLRFPPGAAFLPLRYCLLGFEVWDGFVGFLVGRLLGRCPTWPWCLLDAQVPRLSYVPCQRCSAWCWVAGWQGPSPVWFGLEPRVGHAVIR